MLTDFLVEKFVNNHQQIDEPMVREQYGILCGAVGIVCNLLLFVLKLSVGLLTGAISVIADAFNNLSDAGTAIVTLIGFKLASRPADSEHPFGHGRLEYLTGLFIALAILLVGVELLRTSVAKIITPDTIEVRTAAIVVLILSIGVKLWMAFFNAAVGTRINSLAIAAAKADSLSDCLATGMVLAGMLVYKFTEINIDGFAGLAVSIFILGNGINTVKETLNPLLGQATDKKFVRQIEKSVLEYSGVRGVHDIIVHDYGPGRKFVSLHVEVLATMDMLLAHEMIDDIEFKLHEQLRCEVTIHMDPIIVDNANIDRIRGDMDRLVKTLDSRLTLHDFRMTTNRDGFNLLFDVVVPYDISMSAAEVKELIVRRAHEFDRRYHVVVKIDHAYD